MMDAHVIPLIAICAGTANGNNCVFSSRCWISLRYDTLRYFLVRYLAPDLTPPPLPSALAGLRPVVVLLPDLPAVEPSYRLPSLTEKSIL